jgi:outer membrane protein TolC
MRILFVSFLLSFCSAFYSVSWAQTTPSWQSVLQEASKNNGQIRAARETLSARGYDVKGARNSFLPQLSASVGANYGDTTSQDITLSRGDDSYVTSLNLSQNLFSGLKDKAALEQQEANKRAAEAGLSGVKAQVSYDLVQAYSQLLFAQNSVALQDKIIQRRETNLNLVSLRFKSGRENRGSVLLSEANLNQATYEKLQAKNQLTVASSQLSKVLGRDEDQVIVLKDEIPLEPPMPSPDFKTIAAGVPEVKQNQAQVEASRAGVTVARSGFFPVLGVSAGMESKGTRWYPDQDHWAVGASLTFPLFNGGKDYYASQSAVSQLEAARATLNNVQRDRLATLKQTYSAYEEALQKLKVDESFRKAASKRAEIARAKYQNGLMSFEDWDLIESDLISRERAVLQSQRDVSRAQAAWQQAQGQGVIP